MLLLFQRRGAGGTEPGPQLVQIRLGLKPNLVLTWGSQDVPTGGTRAPLTLSPSPSRSCPPRPLPASPPPWTPSLRATPLLHTCTLCTSDFIRRLHAQPPPLSWTVPLGLDTSHSYSSSSEQGQRLPVSARRPPVTPVCVGPGGRGGPGHAVGGRRAWGCSCRRSSHTGHASPALPPASPSVPSSTVPFPARPPPRGARRDQLRHTGRQRGTGSRARISEVTALGTLQMKKGGAGGR